MSNLWRQSQKKNKFAERLDQIDGKHRSHFLSNGGLPCHQVKPANKSMFKSSLYAKDNWVTPDLKGLRNIEESLERDYAGQCRKYGSAEPSSRMARFTVRLPSGPQSFKYSWLRPGRIKDKSFQAASPETCSTATPLDGALSCSPETPQPQFRGASPGSSDGFGSPNPATSSSSPLTPLPRHQNFMEEDSDDDDEVDDRLTGVRFSKDKLATWFRTLDKNGSGQVSQREFIVHLRKNKDLLELFCRIARTESVRNTRYSEVSTWTKMPGISPASDSETPRDITRASVSSRKSKANRPPRKGVSHREVSKIKEILSEVDTDGSGSMEWPEFVEFFKRAGMLLEYKTRNSLNRTELCQAAEEAEAAEQKRLQDRATQAARAPSIMDGRAYRDVQKLRNTIFTLGLSEEDKCLEGDEEDGEDEDNGEGRDQH
mmetsp:Transcript_30841/g.48074  ORF Transcript_30841/g.48074 Transcript_30841/m.48074 type:complete len:429 (-) Transcript_30841:185-1471(-)